MWRWPFDPMIISEVNYFINQKKRVKNTRKSFLLLLRVFPLLLTNMQLIFKFNLQITIKREFHRNCSPSFYTWMMTLDDVLTQESTPQKNLNLINEINKQTNKKVQSLYYFFQTANKCFPIGTSLIAMYISCITIYLLHSWVLSIIVLSPSYGVSWIYVM